MPTETAFPSPWGKTLPASAPLPCSWLQKEFEKSRNHGILLKLKWEANLKSVKSQELLPASCEGRLKIVERRKIIYLSSRQTEAQ